MVNVLGLYFVFIGLIVFLFKNSFAIKWRAGGSGPAGNIKGGPPLHLKWGIRKSIYLTKLASLVFVVVGILVFLDAYLLYAIPAAIITIILFLWVIISMVMLPNQPDQKN